MNLNSGVCEMGVIIIAIAQGYREGKRSENMGMLSTGVPGKMCKRSQFNKCCFGLEAYYVTYREMMKQQWYITPLFGKGKS